MPILTEASFGRSKTGLAGTAGYRPVSATNAYLAARATAGITHVGSGIYRASVTPPTGTVQYEWDSGEATPLYYTDKIQATPSDVANIVVQPFQAEIAELAIASSVGGVDRPLKVFQNSSVAIAWTVVNGSGARYDMAGHGFSFVVHSKLGVTVFAIDSTAEAAQFSLQSSESDAVMDIISVTLDPEDLVADVVGTHHYKMWDLTADVVLGTGILGIHHAPQS